MKILRMFMLVTGLLLVLVNLSAQDDPFAQEGSLDDPFGESSQTADADPFAETTVDDPFASSDSGKASDPFAENTQSVQSKPKSRRLPVKIDSNEVNERIRETLSHCTTQTFDETPLIEAVRELKEAHDIPIIVDGRALEEIGLSVEEPITISLNNVSLRSFLRLMLGVHDLTYVVRNEVLLITTIETAEQDLDLRMYRLSEPMAAKPEEVILALHKTVMPRAWDEQGGPASVVPILGNVLVVAATETLHEHVQDFLDKVDAALEQQ